VSFDAFPAFPYIELETSKVPSFASQAMSIAESQAIGGSMPKHTVQLDVPKDVTGRAKQDYLATAREFLKEQTVLRMFEAGKLSAGRAARLLGLDRYKLDDLLAKHRISPFNYAREGLEHEAEAVRDLAEKLKRPRKRSR
jgi:predicted HTH domain antitoxin